MMFIVTDLTKVINGVRTVVVWDRDVSNGQLVESELAFFAQDNVGRVWQPRGNTRGVRPGAVSRSPKIWIAGQAGAKAGVHMLAKLRVERRRYLQGFAPDIEFLDTAKVLDTGRSVRVPFDLYSGVVVTDETSPLEPEQRPPTQIPRARSRHCQNWRRGGSGSRDLGAGQLAAPQPRAIGAR